MNLFTQMVLHGMLQVRHSSPNCDPCKEAVHDVQQKMGNNKSKVMDTKYTTSRAWLRLPEQTEIMNFHFVCVHI